MSPFSAVLMDACKVFDYPTFDTYLTLVHATVHKDERWSTEREWRLFTGTCTHLQGDMFAAIEPAEIVLGLRTSPENAARAQKACAKFGIPLRRIAPVADSPDYAYEIVDAEPPTVALR